MPYTQPSIRVSINGNSTSGGAGYGLVGTGTLVLAGGPNVTLSQDGNTISISGISPAGGAFSAGVSNLGNTGGSTGISGTRMVLVGSGNVTLSQSTDVNGHTISIIDTKPSMSLGISNVGNTAGSTGVTGSQIVLVGTGDITLSGSTDSNGATITIDPGIKQWDRFMPHHALASSNAAQVNGTMFLHPFKVGQGERVTATRVDMWASVSISTTNANTLSGSLSLSYGIYTKNGSSLSLASSGSQSFSFSNSSNVTSLYVGVRQFTVPVNINMGPGEYWGAFWWRTSAGSGTLSLSQYFAGSGSSNAVSGPFGSASNASYSIYPGWGIYSASFSSAMPSAFDFSQVNQGAGALRLPLLVMVNATA